MNGDEYLNRPDAQGHLKVMAVLRKWDPIGIITDQNQDEYDTYSSDIVRMLDSGATVNALLKHMKWIVTEQMGIGFNKLHSRACAEELVEFWRSWKSN